MKSEIIYILMPKYQQQENDSNMFEVPKWTIGNGLDGKIFCVVNDGIISDTTF